MALPAPARVPDELKPTATGTSRASKPRASSTASKAGATASPVRTRRRPAAKSQDRAALAVVLAGGNPRVAMADGDAPVQAYIARMPGWKRALGERLDALIVRSVPDVRKAVKWNSPLYGVAGRGWFLGIHTFTRYVKVAFFRGASLRPVPPRASKGTETRYLDIREGDELDEVQLAAWMKQAAALPGWVSARSL